MNNIVYQYILPEKTPPWVGVFSLILIVTGALLFISPLIIFVILYFIPGIDFVMLNNILQDITQHSDKRTLVLVVQGISSFCVFIIAPLIFHFTLVNQPLKGLFGGNKANGALILKTLGILISFMIVNSLFIDLNANMKFPEALSEIEQFLTQTEDHLKVLTQYLTRFESFEYFLLTFLIVAILPGIGEEWVFRGYLQPLFTKIFGNNMHTGIWVAAIIFSAFHMQFYGFIPRLLLGALFGYLFAWSGNLLYPILAHIFNNGLSLIFLYIYQVSNLGFDLESSESAPWPAILLAGLVCTLLMMSFYRQIYNKLSLSKQ
ncbi:MAG: CPBP family intramembrane metalloprotease [Cyclobacteriaceae bacterium]|nr:CPBP family intramembrane metalloprotease [Cyclobacteriaceae bacterium]